MTRSAAVRVPSERGESVRRHLVDAGLLRGDLRIRSEGSFLLLPLVEGAVPPLELGELEEEEFEPFNDRLTPRSYRDLVDCPAEVRESLPRSFDVIGDVVLIRIPPEVGTYARSIGSALLRFVPGARIVGQDHGVHGPERLRSLTRLAGEGEWRTIHHENGVAIVVDLASAYFSPRLAREHAEVAHATVDGETVYDLCCGVGPFSLAIAREERAKRIVAVDKNPAAIALLRESVARARGGGRIEPCEEDLHEFSKRSGAADRVILNLPHEGIKYLPSVARLVRPGGAIHYYEVVMREALSRRAEELMGEMGGGTSRWLATSPRVVHPYSANSDLIAFRFDAAGGGKQP